ncbi:hypothetical protein QWZ13_09930 [Reinekea marina]|uniref:hypothetical protein n=1 Tax=Reinekea marina TaxID=1310421 RepID=UPI0025B587C6|nr:hypothetical protein [Reinekea marina]MDN3649230.1 hypothetical protein [Reinekea marina]
MEPRFELQVYSCKLQVSKKLLRQSIARYWGFDLTCSLQPAVALRAKVLSTNLRLADEVKQTLRGDFGEGLL